MACTMGHGTPCEITGWTGTIPEGDDPAAASSVKLDDNGPLFLNFDVTNQHVRPAQWTLASCGDIIVIRLPKSAIALE